MSASHKTDEEKQVSDIIDAAEEVHHPLDGLVDRTADNPGAPFASDVLDQLVTLKREDRATFELMWSKLKKTGCRMTELDRAVTQHSIAKGRARPTQADELIELAQSAELFHDPDGNGYADLDINGHRETLPVQSRGFKEWLMRLYYKETGGAPSNEALQSACANLQSHAHFDAPERIVYVRVGEHNDKLYLDLCDDTWRAVEIDADGWRVVDSPPVRFRRAQGMQALPIPVAGGSVTELAPFLNVQSDDEFLLVVAWLLGCLRNRGPYPPMVVTGEQGSAKSTFSAVMRGLIDPNTSPLRAFPRDIRDLFIAAKNGHILAFDNVSTVPEGISDTLCMLATGGGFAVRRLFTDDDEVLFKAARPIILNGITDFVTRPDLADRAIFLTLKPIPEGSRRSETRLWTDFYSKRPQILGALLDAVAVGLKRLPEVNLAKKPRMADFAEWATACEPALKLPTTFEQAYCPNREDAVGGVIEADCIAMAVRDLMAERTEWTGTASDLQGCLEQVVGDRIAKSRRWPDGPRALRNELTRAMPGLRKIGIDVVFRRNTDRKRTRMIVITTAFGGLTQLDSATPVAVPSASQSSKASLGVEFKAPDLQTVANDTDNNGVETATHAPATVQEQHSADGVDDADGSDGWEGKGALQLLKGDYEPPESEVA